MKNVLFGTVIVLSTILTSCGTSTPATEEVKPTEDSTKVEVHTEHTTVTTPSVDSTKVEKK